MANVETDVFYFKDDVGKNLYRKKTYYTLCIEQDVLANNKDEADQKFLDGGGIAHSKITKDITDTNEGVETFMVDANYTESDDTKFIGKVKYDTDTYNQTLDEAVSSKIYTLTLGHDEDEPHQLTKIKLVDEKAESDVDVAINLENESKLGK